MTDKRTLPMGTILLFGAWLLTMLVVMVFWRSCAPTLRKPDPLIGVLRPVPTAIEPFRLVDHEGIVFDRTRLAGHWTFLFFGYTHCPDICPATLAQLASVYRMLAERGDGDTPIQAAFVSVDPARDTTEKLAEYITHFNESFVAATGDVPAIDALAKQFGAGYVLEEETAPGEYLVFHTSAIFLTDPQGRLIAVFSQPHDPETIVEQFQQLRALVEE